MKPEIGTKERLLKEAETLVRTRGYSGFSYADISESIGIRKASIHHHFPTKQNLVETLLSDYRGRYTRSLSNIEMHHADALDRINAYGLLYLDGVKRGHGCLCAALATELRTLPESLRTGTTAFFFEHLAWLERIYAEGLSNQQVSADLEAREAARLVLSALEGALMMERLVDGASGFEVTLSALRESLSPD